MPEITESELAPNVKALWQKASSAVNVQNHGYAIKIIQGVLKDAPGFLQGRKVLRNCEVVVSGGPKKKAGLFGLKTGNMKLSGAVKKDPTGALALIETELEQDPYSAELNELLFDAFSALGWKESAAFALETVRQGHPDNSKIMHRLAEFYVADDRTDKAAEVYRDIVKYNPTDSVAIKGEKDCTARASMKKGNWSEQADMRSLMKNQAQFEEMEQASRTGLTRDQMEGRRDQLIAKYNENPNNLAVSKDLAGIFEQLEDWNNAHAFYQWAFSLSNGDASLQTKAGQMKDRAVEQEMKDLEARAAANPDDPEVKALLEERNQRRIAETVEEAKKRVEQNPTDPLLRYELGQALYNAGDFSGAIPQLQQAKRNPHIQSKVLLLLGLTFKAKNMYDMASKQLEDALADMHAMDNVKKETLYEKGLIHEEMGDKTAALEAFKQIYEVDYGYKDVAARVESSYGG
jgi:tetratricopeptide (TPR) repeat protein